MEIVQTGFDGLLELHPQKHNDQRGYFVETFKESLFKSIGIDDTFVQDNQSFSGKGVIRGLHFQVNPTPQAKLIRVVMGKVLDVALDLRSGSNTFGKYFQCFLDDINCKMLYLPEGFAHGFLALEKTILQYKCSSYYDPDAQRGVLWNDPDLKIKWKIDNPMISDKDKKLPFFAEIIKFPENINYR
jgi:dTDP-4-dehydrorhamnose 3,5-epimerase